MGDISNKSLHLTNKIELLSYNKVEQKIAYYILMDSEVNLSITDIALQINSSREALSRTIGDMVKKGYISRLDNKIKILNRIKLEQYLNLLFKVAFMS